jgi:hypothetical protein
MLIASLAAPQKKGDKVRPQAGPRGFRNLYQEFYTPTSLDRYPRADIGQNLERMLDFSAARRQAGPPPARHVAGHRASATAAGVADSDVGAGNHHRR